MSKKLETNEIAGILARYILLVILPLGNLYIFYLLFTPLTAYPVYLILKLFYPTLLLGFNLLIVDGFSISLISACVAGAAYYLLLILNLTTSMRLKTRLNSLVFLFIAFLVTNILRIVIFSILAKNSYSWFNQMHALSWYIGSTLFVVVLWFVNVKLFKIKSVPVYTDIKNIINSVR